MRNYTGQSGPRQHFIRYAPRRPYAADDHAQGVSILPKRSALERAHMQIQPSTLRASIAVDLDHPEALARVQGMDYPLPQLVMVNPANGHLHAHWQLRAPVAFGDSTHPAPRQAFEDLQRQITAMYGGDPAYAHFMAKTPGHPAWRTLEHTPAPYGMAELFEAIPFGVKQQAQQRPQQEAGEGRHQTLFDLGRKWAYGAVKAAKKREDFTHWQARVLAEFTMLNAFASPLPASQVRSLARNVANYTWKHAERLNGSVLSGTKRSLVKSWDREAITAEEATERRAEGGRYSAPVVHAIRRNRTFDAITAAIGELAGQGVLNPTTAQIAVLAGVSTRTVERFRAGSGASQRAGN